MILSVQIEASNLRRAAEQIAYVKRLFTRNNFLDHRFTGRNDFGCILQFWCVERQAQNCAARRVRARKQVKRIIAAEAGDLYLIAKLRDLLPLSIWPEEIMGEVPAITVRVDS